MRTTCRCAMILAMVISAIAAQDGSKRDAKITITVGPSDSPLNAASCKESSYGNLHNGDRTKLTPGEIGEYVARVIKEGNILTIYPESKDGIFVYARCPNSEPKASQ
ncbi:MAG TPA: hypothetical protein VMH80_21735 [Bryobacteraceae bacterium]|nr:hypothetical protein [Bryobacteraceae bacterium]